MYNLVISITLANKTSKVPEGFKIKNYRDFWEISSELGLFANLPDNMKDARSIKTRWIF